MRQGDGSGPKVFKREMFDILGTFSDKLDDNPEQIRITVEYDGKKVQVDVSAYVDDVWKVYAHWIADQLQGQVHGGKTCYKEALATKNLQMEATKGLCLLGERGLSSEGLE